MRVPLSAVLLAACIWAIADDGVAVDSVVAEVRTSIAKKRKDAVTAAVLDKLQLAQHLEDRVIEILESEGAGPQTLGALQRLRDASRFLPAPPDPPKGMTPPPPPSSAEENRAWQTAAEKARDYIRTLPDFICSETIYRWTDPTANEKWQPAPTVVADLSFFDRKEHYQVKTVDGKPSDKSLAELEGAISAGEFGSMMSTIFKPGSETERRWDHWTVLRKRPASVYFFRIAASHHPHELWYRTGPGSTIKAVVGLHGFVYLDPESGSVTRISTVVEEIPDGFPVQKSNTVLDYDDADVGGTLYLLPLRAEVRIDTGELQSLNAVEFHRYRKFGADTNVSFGKDGKR